MADTRPLSERLDAAWVLAQTDSGEHIDPGLLREAAAIAARVEAAPVAIMDTRDVLGICAPTEEDFPALYALQGKRVALVPVEVGHG